MLFMEPNFTQPKTYKVVLLPNMKMAPKRLNLDEILPNDSIEFFEFHRISLSERIINTRSLHFNNGVRKHNYEHLLFSSQ